MRFARQNRVVVTGIGVIAPNGIGADAFWRTLVAGESGIRTISRFSVGELRSTIAGEVRDFDPDRWIEPRFKARRKARHAQFALCATAMALEDAKMRLKEARLSAPVPIVMGVASTNLELVEETVAAVARGGAKRATPLLVSEASPSAAAGSIAQYLEVPVATRTLSSACAAGADAIVEAVDLVRSGESDLVIAGGSDSPLSMVPFANFDAAGMASRHNAEPERASRPFDLRRDSGVISEGCAIVVLENLEHAIARGAEPYLEILGFGRHTDGPGGSCSGLEFSMRKALEDSALMAQDIDYVCAWAPGHPIIDKIETELIKRVFGTHAYGLAASSIKGVTGNPLAAAGPMMLASCCLAFRHNIIPPTANLEEPDPACDLDHVPKVFRRQVLNRALMNSHGLGGSNTSIALGRL